jgi:hypothetical protein
LYFAFIFISFSFFLALSSFIFSELSFETITLCVANVFDVLFLADFI